MRLEIQRIGALFVAVLLGGSISLSLFVLIIFLIEPERASNTHLTGPYVVTFVDMEHGSKAKKRAGKRMRMPKLPANPEVAPIESKSLQKVTNKKISVRFPTIGSIDIFSAGPGRVLNLDIGTEENYHSKNNRKVQFNQVEGEFAHSEKEQEIPPERFRMVGGGEIDRIGKYCFEVPGAGGSGSGDTGQSAVAEDESYAMHSLYARQVPCDKSNRSFAEDFLKQLKIREPILSPVSLTH